MNGKSRIGVDAPLRLDCFLLYRSIRSNNSLRPSGACFESRISSTVEYSRLAQVRVPSWPELAVATCRAHVRQRARTIMLTLPLSADILKMAIYRLPCRRLGSMTPIGVGAASLLKAPLEAST